MGKLLKNFKPHVDFRAVSGFASKDVLFNWAPLEIPKGGAVELKSISHMIRGTDTGVGNGGLDFRLLFAKPINAAAPPSLSVSNLTITAIEAATIRPYLIGTAFMNGAEMEDSNDTFVNYNFGSTAGYSTLSTTDVNHHLRNFSPIMLEGEHYAGSTIEGNTYAATTSGNQTIFVAGIALGAFNFGTGVLLNQGGDQATSTTAVGLVTDGTDADDIFAIGDEVVFGGNANTDIGTVTAVTANTLTVDTVDNAMTDDDEIFFKHPIQFNFGFEY
tara:strand:- start:1110 stop:1928 length:819 start_codon:yes stop_codon:yes gene_type:complete